MSELYSNNEPSQCKFSDACRYIVDLRKSAPNPFEHLTPTEFSMVMSEIVEASRIIRQNADLIDSLETSEMNEIARSIYSLDKCAKEVGRQ